MHFLEKNDLKIFKKLKEKLMTMLSIWEITCRHYFKKSIIKKSKERNKFLIHIKVPFSELGKTVLGGHCWHVTPGWAMSCAGENAVSVITHWLVSSTKETRDFKYSDFLLNNTIYDNHILSDQVKYKIQAVCCYLWVCILSGWCTLITIVYF